jgi:Uma2 family endonuclease
MTSLVTIPSQASFPLWRPATWDDYLCARDASSEDVARVFFDEGYLLTERDEGIEHSRFNRFLALVFFLWFAQHDDRTCDDLGGCQIEKAGVRAAAPDAVLYIGEGSPQFKMGESRFIDLDRWRVPDLVAEVSDTTLASDLDEKKQLYSALRIPEYWVVDVRGLRVLAFRLDEGGRYEQVEVSVALTGLPISLLDQTLIDLGQGVRNSVAAQGFAQAIQAL